MTGMVLPVIHYGEIFHMGMVDFTRGELSPSMKYRSDLEAYHKGVEKLQNFLPTPRGGLVRRPGSQVLEILPQSEAFPAVRMFTLGATGKNEIINAPGDDATVEIGDATYDTKNRIHPLPFNSELRFVMTFTEPNDIALYWINTPDTIPAYLQRVWNLEDGDYVRPALGFQDTRDVRIVQIEQSVYVVAYERIYRIYWDLTKQLDENLAWSEGQYDIGDVVYKVVGSTIHWFQCIREAAVAQADPTSIGGSTDWDVVYPPMISWEVVSPRVGLELLKGAGIEDDPYEWITNRSWESETAYVKGDVVQHDPGDGMKIYECIANNTSQEFIDEPAADTPSATYWRVLPAIDDEEESDFVADKASMRLRSTYAYRGEAVPRNIVAHHNRLIFAGSSSRPSTIFGSEVGHYLNFGTGINDNEPWIFKLSGDRVGKILWLAVTDQLYLGTSGGVFAVSGVLTPNQFQLRKITSHGASDIQGVAASGALLFFQSDGKSLREVEYAEQAQNWHAYDLTVFSDHLFSQHRAIKMVVQHNPNVTVWIVNEEGFLISLTYEKTVGLSAFANHSLHGGVIDIAPGTGDDLYAIVRNIDGYDELTRLGVPAIIQNEFDEGDVVIQHVKHDVHLDGLIRFVNIDTSFQFATDVPNESFRAWAISASITSKAAMLDRTADVDASDSDIEGDIATCMLHYFEQVTVLNVSGNSLTGIIPRNLANISGLVTLNLSDNELEEWEGEPANPFIIPATLQNLDLSGNQMGSGTIQRILSDILLSVASADRTGTVDLTGELMGTLDYDTGLLQARELADIHGWTVLINNEGTPGEWSFIISFNANGGTGSPPASETDILIGESITIPDENTLTREGFTFIGWQVEIEEVTTDYTPGQSFTLPVESNVTFYAIWASVFGITYNANGGGGAPTDSDEYEIGDPITVAAPGAMSRTGHTFSHWNTLPTGLGTSYNPGETITMGDGGVELHAIWTVNTYTITYDGNGNTEGTVPASQTVEYGASVTLRNNTGNLGRTLSSGERRKLAGWRRGTTNYALGGTLSNMPAQNITLSARWTDYYVGDPGPGGGIVFRDEIYYDTKILRYSSALWGSNWGYRQIGPFRYIEVWPQDLSTGNWVSNQSITLNGYSDWNRFPSGFSTSSYDAEWLQEIHALQQSGAIDVSPLTSGKYWLYQCFANWGNPRGYHAVFPGFSTSSGDSNSNNYRRRPVRWF